MWTVNFQMFKLYLEKAEEPEIKFPTYIQSSKKQEHPEIASASLHWLCQSLWLCGSQQTVDNSERAGNTREICMQVKKKQLELDMEQQTGSKSGKDQPRLYIFTQLI